MINYIQDDNQYKYADFDMYDIHGNIIHKAKDDDRNKQRSIYSRFKEIYRYLQRSKRFIAYTIGWCKRENGTLLK